MVYLTQYHLEVEAKGFLPSCEHKPSSTRTFCPDCGKKNDPFAMALSDHIHDLINNDGNLQEPVKWYDHEIEILAVSKQYPEAFITLTGYGEEHDDIWRKYFTQGKVQKTTATITIIFELFDPKKLE